MGFKPRDSDCQSHAVTYKVWIIPARPYENSGGIHTPILGFLHCGISSRPTSSFISVTFASVLSQIAFISKSLIITLSSSTTLAFLNMSNIMP